MKKSRKHMWGGMWPFDSGNAAGTTANPAANAAPAEKPGVFDFLLGKKTYEQEIADKKEQITKLNSEITEIQMKSKPTPIATSATGTGSATDTSATGETGSATGESATTGETGSATIGGGKRSRRRRGRKTKRSRRSRRHR